MGVDTVAGSDANQHRGTIDVWKSQALSVIQQTGASNLVLLIRGVPGQDELRAAATEADINSSKQRFQLIAKLAVEVLRQQELAAASKIASTQGKLFLVLSGTDVAETLQADSRMWFRLLLVRQATWGKRGADAQAEGGLQRGFVFE